MENPTSEDVCKEETCEEPTHDTELDDLLDNALEDFDKIPTQPVRTSSEINNDFIPPSVGATETKSSQDAMFNQLFDTLSENPDDAKAMENLFKSLMSGDTAGFAQHLQGLDMDEDLDAPTSDFAKTLQDTMGSLAQNVQQLENENFSEDELMRMMSNFGLDGGGAEGGGGATDDDIIPLMQGMMKNLLSKDVLYPSLKDISVQYPAWLREHEGKIDAKDYEKYERQYSLMSSIVSEFDTEQSTDSDDTKRLRFERILDIMQQMQELGHPPKEIVGDMPALFDVDENGTPKFPSMMPGAEQCRLM